MARAYIRLDPGFTERKASYPDGAYAALIDCFCLAELQPERGRFRSERFLKVLLDKRGRWVRYLLDHHDLSVLSDGRVYLEGWDEWQEGDWKVGERVQRIRGRRVTANVTPAVTPAVTVETVTPATAPTVLPVRLDLLDSAGAGGGAGVSEKASSSPRGRSAPSDGMPDVRLTAEQLAAWTTFGPEWRDFKRAWLRRGFLWPPAGEPGDDDTSQRGLLWQVLDARPTDLVRWVRLAPGKTSRQVIDYVLDCWHEVRTEVDPDEPDAPSAPAARREAMERLGRITERLRLGGSPA